MSKTNLNASKNASAKENASPASAKINSFNLESLASQLDAIQLKEKKEKETIYVYPQGMTKDEISGEKGKKFRNHLRRKLESFSNNILFFAKGKKMEDLQKEIDLFMTHYKTFYRRNDLSIDSLSQSRNESKSHLLSLSLQIIKGMQK